MAEIDWLSFDKYPEDTIECSCGQLYRSHAKGRIIAGNFVVATRKPCPKCGAAQDHVRRASSDPELVTIGEP